MTRPDLTITHYQAHTLAMPRTSDLRALAAITAAANIARYGRHVASRTEINKAADPRLVRLARQLAAANAADL